ncbi:uncharacterized protein LOC113777530 [Coffea eugenioides]|uniref:acetylglutamate kinase n=1 Tax=Coffea arabica TaxID=13443 RepID=A0A6P6TJG8_COFAR|nr:uncharacterized protein LOC113701284 [Coffea arabica]XP_027077656.1 uncharacterized protein LOC113701284 [Coffea arabica]XP_027077657.1 uncharacterized protein LOC113701284 [Coffea arabica]XP_027077658.1 uncharacterized protein LOC113701284 [Coffea arabica]XP_027077659.1 uncharacterized protein LOC113701284 [Coffea arabica]XP_027077660.1 uncharacterized protein LOC113701284 [Coffea arabica]XP_027178448.1 uncharacterized protein LOC113777530 [Coffea eugenioides]
MLPAKSLPLSSALIKAPKSPDANLTSTNCIGINKWITKKYTNPSLSFRSSCHGTSSEPVVVPEARSISAQKRVNILPEALPYIEKFHGKTIVVKYGGAAMKSEALQASVMSDLVLLSRVGLRIVMVHGGGPEINQWLGRLGSKPKFVNGSRVTDATTMKIVSMVLAGEVNTHLVALINKAGASAVGLSGMDGRLLTARPSQNSDQLGFVGDIATVDPTVLRLLIDNGHIPVIASVAADKTGQSYNINADIAAGEVAAALAAEKLILLTDVAGILEDQGDPGSLVKELDIQGARRMMNDGKIAGGMFQKVDCCVRSVAQGVRTATILDGRVQHSLLLEILTDEGVGTMITG